MQNNWFLLASRPRLGVTFANTSEIFVILLVKLFFINVVAVLTAQQQMYKKQLLSGEKL